MKAAAYLASVMCVTVMSGCVPIDGQDVQLGDNTGAKVDEVSDVGPADEAATTTMPDAGPSAAIPDEPAENVDDTCAIDNEQWPVEVVIPDPREGAPAGAEPTPLTLIKYGDVEPYRLEDYWPWYRDKAPQITLDRQLGPVFWTENTDLDGDGHAEQIDLRMYGSVSDPLFEPGVLEVTVVAGGDGERLVQRLDLLESSTEDLQVEVVSIADGPDRQIWIRRHNDGWEDPPKIHAFITFDGTTLRLAEIAASHYGDGKFDPEAGTFIAKYSTCRQQSRSHFTIRNYALVPVRAEIELFDSGDWPNVPFGGECAACPFVYTKIGGQWRYQGEILRDLYTPELESEQELEVTFERNGPLIPIRLTEEKEEITYLDAIALELPDGARIKPTVCNTKPDATMCTDDGRYHVLHRGDVLDLEFESDATTVKVIADGYYLPLPTPFSEDVL